MNLPFLFARRYLLAKRSANAVNIITGISIVVVAVVTAAMVVVLSTLNGITELVDTLHSPFDQDVTITPAEGKRSRSDSLDLGRFLAWPDVQAASWADRRKRSTPKRRPTSRSNREGGGTAIPGDERDDAEHVRRRSNSAQRERPLGAS
ncbi:MAG: hypothetical protein IPP83_10250 [Flavobacteriales bacterium]|nr:hypothetical protein [Flavobacteriales bacterium]